MIALSIGYVDLVAAAQYKVVQNVRTRSRWFVALEQFSFGIEVHDFGTVFLPRICCTPHAVIRRIDAHSADRHQIVDSFFYKIGNFAGFRNADDLVVVLASHVEDSFRSVDGQTFGKEIVLRDGECDARPSYGWVLPSHTLDECKIFRIVVEW